mgnify:CR=1 FL=1
MPSEVFEQLQRTAQLPLGVDEQVADITGRNAIPTSRRWDGMLVYVISEQRTYVMNNTGSFGDGDWQQVPKNSDIP